MSNFTREAFRTARKVHRCEVCRKPIRVGTRYRYASGRFDGEAFSSKTHRICGAMINALFDVDAFSHVEGYYPEEVRETMRECLLDSFRDLNKRTMAAWRKSLREMRGK
jgi:hypothetical protein